MKKIFFLIVVFIFTGSFAQKNIHNYKYIIVPKQFSFVKKIDGYQTSSLTKFLFNKEGFVTFFNDEILPNDLRNNRCLALTANVENASSMFTTKNIIQLRDCNNKIIFTSIEGTSKEKDYKKGYHQAIRNAFKSVSALNYKYKPLRQENVIAQPPRSNNTQQSVNNQNSQLSKRNTVVDNRGNRNDNPFGSNRIPVLDAQRDRYGFKLFNVKRQLVFNVLKTELKDVFIITGKNGVLYKQNNNWIAEFYNAKGDKVIKEYDVRMTPPSRH